MCIRDSSLDRLYGIAFPKASGLEEYLKLMEEAAKRDHRRLGKELELFTLLEEGPGFPFFLPKGMVLKNTLIDFWRQIHREAGYQEISTDVYKRQVEYRPEEFAFGGVTVDTIDSQADLLSLIHIFPCTQFTSAFCSFVHYLCN